MIKLRMAAIMAAIMLLTSLAYGELSCDLAQGTLNGLRVGGATDSAALKSILNEPPVIPESFVPQTEFYKFLGRGIEIVTQEVEGKELIHTITIRTLRFKDMDGNTFEAYSGNFSPALSVNDRVAAVRVKFGAPKKEYLPVAGSPIPASTQLIYQTAYGELSFWFNENGRLGPDRYAGGPTCSLLIKKYPIQSIINSACYGIIVHSYRVSDPQTSGQHNSNF